MTINEREFHKLCKDARAEKEGVIGLTERYAALVEAIFLRLCHFLGLDPAQQQRELGGGNDFLVIQTLEEHMNPRFDYTVVLNAYV